MEICICTIQNAFFALIESFYSDKYLFFFFDLCNLNEKFEFETTYLIQIQIPH